MAKQTKAQARRDEIEAAKAELRKILTFGSVIRVCVDGYSKHTNMTWYVRVFVPHNGDVFVPHSGEIRNITYLVGNAIDWPLVEYQHNRCIKGSGIGTNRYFEIGHVLSYALHGVRTEDTPDIPLLSVHGHKEARVYGRTLRAVRTRMDALRKAADAECDGKYHDSPHVKCKVADGDHYRVIHSDACAKAAREAREAENILGKYRAGYTIRGEAL